MPDILGEREVRVATIRSRSTPNGSGRPVIEASLVREGEYWSVGFDGRMSRVRNSKGLRYLDHLLRYPGREVHALALVAAIEGHGAGPQRSPEPGLVAGHQSGGDGETVDAQALSAYRRRLADLRAQLGDAELLGDAERAARATAEIDALAAQVAEGVGLGGRPRRAGGPAERARLAVTKAVRAVIQRLEAADPELGRHLDRAIRTGAFCVYLPDPALVIRWRFGVDAAAVTAGIRSGGAGDDAPLVQAARPRRGIYVGRATERAVLAEQVDAVAAGRGGLVLVTGEAGIGKTRLAEVGCGWAAERGMSSLLGHCRETDAAVPWAPIVEALEQLARALPDATLRDVLGAEASDVGKLVPALRRRFPDLPHPLDLPPEQARAVLFGSVCDVLERLARRRPLVLVVEDAHWADPSSLALVEHLADRLPAAPVLLIVTFRSVEAGAGSPLGRTAETLLRRGIATLLPLAALDVEDVAVMVGALSGGQASAELARRVAAETDGNPFFVEEVVKHLTEHEPAALPETLRLVLGQRLHRMSEACRLMLAAAATIGRDMDYPLLASVGPLAGEELDRALDEALVAQVLVPGPGEERLAFRHALVRQAVLEQLTDVRRRRLHAQIAAALQRRDGDGPEHVAEIAEHLVRAGSHADATTTVRYLHQAARLAVQAVAYEDAAARLERALTLVPSTEVMTRARLLADLGYARRSLSQHDDAMADWTAAVDLAERQPDGVALAAQLCLELGRSFDITGRVAEGLAAVRRGLRLVGTGETAERARLLAALGYAQSLSGLAADVAASLRDAAAIAVRLGDERLRDEIAVSQTMAHFMAGRFADAVAEAPVSAASPSGEVGPEIWPVAQAVVSCQYARIALARFDEMERIDGVLMPTMRRIGSIAIVAGMRRSAAVARLARTGNVAELASFAADDIDVCATHHLRWRADAHLLAGQAAWWRDDVAGARNHFEAAAQAPAPAVYTGRYTAALLVLHAWRGDAASFDALAEEHARQVAAQGLGRTMGTRIFRLALLEGLAVLGRRVDAAPLYAAARDELAAGNVLRLLDLRLIESLAGLGAGAAGEPAVAREHFARARRQAEAMHVPRAHADQAHFQDIVDNWCRR